MALTPANNSIADVETARLHMAMELSASRWLLAFGSGGRQCRCVSVRAGDAKTLVDQVERAKKRLCMPSETRVVSCHEAGRDGFWIHRLLMGLRIENVVVDAASMKVERRGRRVKSDRVDAKRLLHDLIRHHRGDSDVWRVVHVPDEEVEDRRRLHRDLERLKKEHTQHRVRIGSLLATQGIPAGGVDAVLRDIASAKKWDGDPIPAGLQREIVQERARLGLVEQQIRELETERKECLKGSDVDIEKVKRLETLRGIGIDTAWILTMEFFWRGFRNRREVGGAAGLGGTPYTSGNSEREQGISKAGNPRIRTRMIELAWLWLRYQPQSRLSQWFQKKFANGGSRRRRVGIVALARLLLIALWHYVEHGVVPAGAVLTPVGAKACRN